MVYILNTPISGNKKFLNAVTKLYGIGLVRSLKLASILGLHPSSKVNVLNFTKLHRLTRLIERSFLVDFELKRRLTLNLSFLKTAKTYRGFRHSSGMPTRGQRTHTNASTQTKLKLARTSNFSSTLSTDNRTKFNRFKTKSNTKVKLNSKLKNKNKNK